MVGKIDQNLPGVFMVIYHGRIRKKSPHKQIRDILGGGFNQSQKYCTVLVKLDHFPRDRGENKQCLSCHHLELGESWLVNRDPYTHHGLLSSLYYWASWSFQPMPWY